MHDPDLVDPYLLALKASEPEVDIQFWRHATSEQRGKAIAFLMGFGEAMVALRGWRDPPEDLPCVKELLSQRHHDAARGRSRVV